MSDPDYCYPPSFEVLRNKFGIRDARQLEYFEREFVTQRAAEDVPAGIFDLAHLKSIHRHLFQDIYEWAGQVRTIEIAKDGHQFQFRHYIETGMADIHKRLISRNYLRDLLPDAFSLHAAEIVGDLNYVHPFREGNGRTQLLYLDQLATQAGHRMDLRKIERQRWTDASRSAHGADYAPMSRCILGAIVSG